MDEPKPCPFCGKNPSVVKVEVHPAEWFVSCGKLCVEQKHLYSSKHAAITAWNRRKEDEDGRYEG